MRFTYWGGTDLGPIAEAVAHWRAALPGFEVVGDAAVEAAMAGEWARFLPVFRRIGTPACRSDVARLVMLEAHGGFYADAHFAVTRPDEARRFVEQPGAPVVMLARAAREGEAPGLRPINGLMSSTAGHALVRNALRLGLERLERRMEAEDRGAREPYDIFRLAGSGAIRDVLLADPFTVRPEYADAVVLAPEADAPFQRNVFKSYQQPGEHWSERQRREPLFLPPDQASSG